MRDPCSYRTSDWFGRNCVNGSTDDWLVLRKPLVYEVENFLCGSRRYIPPHKEVSASVEAKTASNV
jgi:hypothetical protein